MGRFIDLTGQRFGIWLVIKKAENDKHGASRWLCRCECGEERIVLGKNLRKGESKGCGCKREYHNFIDLTGQRFGRWKVIEKSGHGKWGEVFWLCRCDCGTERIVSGVSLRNHRSMSCGCWNKEKAVIHGKTNTRIFNIWCGMKKRCANPNHRYFKDYGGRGIKVFSKWVHDFQSFYDYVSALPHFDEQGYTLDRWPNKNGNYEPGNLRWTTQKGQCRNKRNTLMVGDKALVQICEEQGLPYTTVWRRINRYGWTIQRALTTPIQRHKRKRET